MKISIIIPAFNEEKLIGKTLGQVASATAAFTPRGWETELIVCDNNSTDRTAELARGAGAQVVFEPVNQIARARNTGAAAATGDWLVFVDADSQPTVELFGDVAAEVISGRSLAGGATVKLAGNHLLPGAVVWLWNWTSRLTRWMAGSFIFCEAKAFRSLGGFSQELFVTEEIELSRRLKVLAKRSGKQIAILHRHPLLTSDRKLHLYTLREHFSFLVRATVGRGRAFNDRSSCQPWYDGRR